MFHGSSGIGRLFLPEGSVRSREGRAPVHRMRDDEWGVIRAHQTMTTTSSMA